MPNLLVTLTIVPLSGSERRVTEPLAPKEGESGFTYLSSLSFVIFAFFDSLPPDSSVLRTLSR